MLWTNRRDTKVELVVFEAGPVRIPLGKKESLPTLRENAALAQSAGQVRRIVLTPTEYSIPVFRSSLPDRNPFQ